MKKPIKYDLVIDFESTPRRLTPEEIKALELQRIQDKEEDLLSFSSDAKKEETRLRHAEQHAIKVADKYAALPDVETEWAEKHSFIFPYVEIVGWSAAVIHGDQIVNHTTDVGWGCIESFSLFWDLNFELAPRLVGFNSNDFDIPLLIHCLARKGLKLTPKIGTAYGDKLDLRQYYTGFKGKGTLKDIAREVGTDSQYDEGDDGSMIRGLVLNEKWDKIREYVATDVDVTTELLLRLKKVVAI